MEVNQSTPSAGSISSCQQIGNLSIEAVGSYLGKVPTPDLQRTVNNLPEIFSVHVNLRGMQLCTIAERHGYSLQSIA